ncbi:MAG: hypothetical protein WBN61_00285, partial [Woeseiaceae bacterium]
SHELDVRIPAETIAAWGLDDGSYALREQLYGQNNAQLIVKEGRGRLRITLDALASAVLKVEM